MFTMVKRVAIGSAFAATVAIAPAVPAAAAPSVPCSFGYVCVALSRGTIVSVPEGQSKSFPGGATMTGIANRTTTPYCVLGSLSFNLAAGAEVIRTQSISAFGPGRICLT